MLDVVGRDVVVGLAVVLLWSANGCNNFAISRPGWARKLTILRANTSDRDLSSKVFPFSLVSVLVLLLLFFGCVIISCSISSRSTSCSAFIMIGIDSNKNSTRARRVL